jgi:hypothetical protein
MGWRGFGFVHHSRTVFCRAAPNPNLTIRDFRIAAWQAHLKHEAPLPHLGLATPQPVCAECLHTLPPRSPHACAVERGKRQPPAAKEQHKCVQVRFSRGRVSPTRRLKIQRDQGARWG